MQRYGLSVGRGVQLGARSGWVSADLTRESRSSGTAKAWKLDATLGLNARTERALAPMFQIELHRPDDGAATFAVLPSLRLSRRAKRTWLGESGVAQDARAGSGAGHSLWPMAGFLRPRIS